MVNLPKKVRLTEVVARDGFQQERDFIPTEKKIELINMLSDIGFYRIEVTSFVHPKAIPQMRDASEVMSCIKRADGVIYTCLVPNEKGAERALEAGASEMNMVLSASERHNQENLRMSVEDSLKGVKAVKELIEGESVSLICSIATSFGCPFEGVVPEERAIDLVAALWDLGIEEITLADTTGLANPLLVERRISAIKEKFPSLRVSIHLHDTRGMGLANLLSALENGVVHFDSSLGGIGGCPFAPGATGVFGLLLMELIRVFFDLNWIS